jgi:hypothetical protein
MLLRPKLAGLFAALVVSAALLFPGCSSSHPRDLHWGTDADLFYVPPDAPPAAVDSANAADGGMAVDASMDGDDIDASIDGES